METINSFDFLIALIKACQATDEDPRIEPPEGFDARLGGSRYLLNQSIRQFWDRPGHMFVTKKALELWNKLKIEEPIFKYYYQKPIFYKNVEPVYVESYKGANKTSDSKGHIQYKGKKECFRFRQVFHREHIVPVNIIIDQLLKIDLSKEKADIYKEIDAAINKIYICFMLKEENIRLNGVAKNNRSDNYRQVLDTDYAKAQIEIVEGYTNEE